MEPFLVCTLLYSHRIWRLTRKIRTRKNSAFRHFSLSALRYKYPRICYDHRETPLDKTLAPCVSVCVCVCVCVCTSIHRESLICLDQVGYQGTYPRCYVEDVEFLCRFPSSILQNAEPNLSASRFILFMDQKRAEPRLNQCTSRFQNMGPSFTIQQASPSVRTTSQVDLLSHLPLTRGLTIYLGKAKVTANFSIESSLRQSTQPSPNSLVSVSENVIFHLQRRKPQPALNWRDNDMI